MERNDTMGIISLRRGLFIALLALAALSQGLFGETIGRIAVLNERDDTGYVPEALSQRVFFIIRSRVDGEFSEKVLNDDIKELILSGSFEDVRVERVRLEDGRIGLNFHVVPRPVLRGIVFRGNKEYETGKLLSAIDEKLVIGRSLDEKTKASARMAILEKYYNGGYYGTEVSTLEEKPEDGEGGVVLVFEVKEVQKHKLEGTYFENNTVFDASELRSAIVTQRQWWRYIFRFGNYFNPDLLPSDTEALRKLYHNAGYLDFEVIEVKREYDEDNSWVSVRYVLQEGEPYTVSSVSVKGNTTFSSEDLLGEISTKAGMVYSAAREQQDCDALKSRYGRLGYLEVHAWPKRELNPREHTVAVTYSIHEGEIIHIRDIHISGNTLTREKVIRRELAIQPDDLGDPELLDISKSRLLNLGYFSKVEITPAVTERPDIRDLRIRLEEKPTGNVGLGAAYSSSDSALAQIEFTETNFDLERLLDWEMPPKGAGQRFRTRVQAGDNVQNVIVSFEEPWFLDRRLSLSTDFFVRMREEDEYRQRNIGLQVMLSCPIAVPIPFTDITEKNWRMGAGVRFEHIRVYHCDKYDESDESWLDRKGDFVRDRVIADEACSEFANRLIWRISRDSRDQFRFATKGSLMEFQAEYVTRALGSYEDYFRFDLSGARYFQLPTYQILKLYMGVSTATGDDKVAIFDRYFGGGIGQIRGFKRRMVSPVDHHEDPLGGNTMLVGTVELLQPIRDSLYASVFYDIGNVWEDSFHVDSDLCMSVGVGLQFKALPISLYYGYPIGEGYDHLEGKSGRFHFNLGFTY